MTVIQVDKSLQALYLPSDLLIAPLTVQGREPSLEAYLLTTLTPVPCEIWSLFFCLFLRESTVSLGFLSYRVYFIYAVPVYFCRFLYLALLPARISQARVN